MARDQKSEDTYNEIDENLRKAYEEMVNEELPDRFKYLVQELKRSTQANSIATKRDDGDVE